MIVTNDIKYVGVNDHQIDLFEGQFPVPNGMAYNSYVILDEKIAVVDSVDVRFKDEWIENVKKVARRVDYLIIQHMEPDHSSSIVDFISAFPEAQIVASAKAFDMMKNFFQRDLSKNAIIATDKSTLSLGKHTLTFFTAPMVHWPEVIVSYDSYDKVLFSADAFGKFGANDQKEDWLCEARRYYFGIVGKYGIQVSNLLKKLQGLEINIICSLHGPILNENLGYYIGVYDKWSKYESEERGTLIAYTSVYGNTKKTALLLEKKLRECGCKAVNFDLARCDIFEAIEDAFKYDSIVFATTTYNNDVFPKMKEFINHLTERNFSNKKIGFIENGSWAPTTIKTITGMLKDCKNLSYYENKVKLISSLSQENLKEIEALAMEIAKDQK